MPDFTVQSYGSVSLLRTHTDSCEQWIEEHVVGETTYFGSALVVEHRYIAALVEGLESEGFEQSYERDVRIGDDGTNIVSA